MRLADALRFQKPLQLALVGAGGKSTAMFTLARQWAGEGPVWVTTTTHLGVDQAALADVHRIIQTPAEVEALPGESLAGVILLTGPAAEAGRYGGLKAASLESLHQLSLRTHAPLLVEADGSRRLPLKAPAEHEPAIPAWVNQVLVVAGMSGLDRPLAAESVHRPEHFAQLSGLSLGEPVSLEAEAKVLSNPMGGLKNIPAGAQRIALLNQAASPEQQAQASRLAEKLLLAYSAVLVADLRKLDQNEQVSAVHTRVAGILLAAGGSQRLGRPKQLLEWRGMPLVRHVAEAALKGGLDPLIIVVGAAAEGVRAALAGLPVTIVENPYWQSGQGSSVRAGVAALPGECGAAIFLLADMPQVPATLLRALVERHATTLAPLVAPLVDGQRANPVLFDRITFAELLNLSGDTGGRALFARYHPEWLEWHDRSLLLDVDTLKDYQRLEALE